MKLPDSEPLSHEEYWIITDQWKQEWERGVQVPVNPDSLPEPSDKHYLTNTPAIADSVCSYDLDQLDEAWLKEFNGERSLCGLPSVNEEQFERIVEELEVSHHSLKVQFVCN